MSRRWYEVRVRERKNGKDVKKSKFYRVPSPQDAARKYHGSGHIMSIQKVQAPALHGVAEFFKLGDAFLKELRSETQEVASAVDVRKENKRRGFYARRRKEAAIESRGGDR